MHSSTNFEPGLTMISAAPYNGIVATNGSGQGSKADLRCVLPLLEDDTSLPSAQMMPGRSKHGANAVHLALSRGVIQQGSDLVTRLKGLEAAVHSLASAGDDCWFFHRAALHPSTAGSTHGSVPAHIAAHGITALEWVHWHLNISKGAGPSTEGEGGPAGQQQYQFLLAAEKILVDAVRQSLCGNDTTANNTTRSVASAETCNAVSAAVRGIDPRRAKALARAILEGEDRQLNGMPSFAPNGLIRPSAVRQILLEMAEDYSSDHEGGTVVEEVCAQLLALSNEFAGIQQSEAAAPSSNAPRLLRPPPPATVPLLPWINPNGVPHSVARCHSLHHQAEDEVAALWAAVAVDPLVPQALHDFYSPLSLSFTVDLRTNSTWNRHWAQLNSFAQGLLCKADATESTHILLLVLPAASGGGHASASQRRCLAALSCFDCSNQQVFVLQECTIASPEATLEGVCGIPSAALLRHDCALVFAVLAAQHRPVLSLLSREVSRETVQRATSDIFMTTTGSLPQGQREASTLPPHAALSARCCDFIITLLSGRTAQVAAGTQVSCVHEGASVLGRPLTVALASSAQPTALPWSIVRLLIEVMPSKCLLPVHLVAACTGGSPYCEGIKLLLPPLVSSLDQRSQCTGETPLTAAVRSRQIANAEYLMSIRPDCNACNANGLTPLMLAVLHGLESVTLRLLHVPALELNRRGPGGKTALLLSILGPHQRLAMHLVRAGAAVDIADDDGLTPLLAAKFFSPALCYPLLLSGALIHGGSSVAATTGEAKRSAYPIKAKWYGPTLQNVASYLHTIESHFSIYTILPMSTAGDGATAVEATTASGAKEAAATLRPMSAARAERWIRPGSARYYAASCSLGQFLDTDASAVHPADAPRVAAGGAVGGGGGVGVGRGGAVVDPPLAWPQPIPYPKTDRDQAENSAALAGEVFKEALRHLVEQSRILQALFLVSGNASDDEHSGAYVAAVAWAGMLASLHGALQKLPPAARSTTEALDVLHSLVAATRTAQRLLLLLQCPVARTNPDGPTDPASLLFAGHPHPYQNALNSWGAAINRFAGQGRTDPLYRSWLLAEGAGHHQQRPASTTNSSSSSSHQQQQQQREGDGYYTAEGRIAFVVSVPRLIEGIATATDFPLLSGEQWRTNLLAAVLDPAATGQASLFDLLAFVRVLGGVLDERSLEAFCQLAATNALHLEKPAVSCTAALSAAAQRAPYEFCIAVGLESVTLYQVTPKLTIAAKPYTTVVALSDEVQYHNGLRYPKGTYFKPQRADLVVVATPSS